METQATPVPMTDEKAVSLQVGGATATDGKKKGKDGKDKKNKDKKKRVSCGRLFRFADKKDATLMVFGTIAAMANGLILPSFAIIFGRLIDAFNEPNAFEKIRDFTFVFVLLGKRYGVFVSAADLSVVCRSGVLCPQFHASGIFHDSQRAPGVPPSSPLFCCCAPPGDGLL